MAHINEMQGAGQLSKEAADAAASKAGRDELRAHEQHAAGVFHQTRNAGELFHARARDLSKEKWLGDLDEDTYARASGSLARDLMAQAGPHFGLTGDYTEGSAGAYSAQTQYENAMRQSDISPQQVQAILQQQLQTQQEQALAEDHGRHDVEAAPGRELTG